MYENKVAIIVLDNLLSWQKLNVVSFLGGSIAIDKPETHGESFITSDGKRFFSFIKNPILIYKAENNESIKRAFNRASDRDLSIGIYTKSLFNTRSGEENIIEIKKYASRELDLAGIIIYGPNKKVDKALNGLKFHD